MSALTPKKVRSNLCLVCADTNSSIYTKLDTKSGQEKDLAKLLQLYGGINVIEGGVCRNCERKLLGLHKTTTDFRKKCQESFQHVQTKRMHPTTPGKENKRPQVDGAVTPVPQESTETPQYVKAPARLLAPKALADHFGTSSEVGTKSTETPQCSTRAIRPLAPKALADHFTCSKVDTKTKEPQKKKRHKRCVAVPESLQTFIQEEDVAVLGGNDFARICAVLGTRNPSCIAATLMKIKPMQRALLQEIVKEIRVEEKRMGVRKRGDVSYLMRKDFQAMETFSWTEVVQEGCKRHPLLITLLAQSLLAKDDMAKLEEHIPRLGMLYGMLMQGRNQELSLVQRVNSMVLYDNLCDQKVFDRLQPLGVTMSYSTNNSLLDMIGGHFDSKVVEAVAQHRRFRLIGDNINWKTDPSEEREDHHREWNHAFGSLAIIQNLDFDTLPNIAPQVPHYVLPDETFLLNKEDWTNIRYEYIVHIARVLAEHVHWFKFLKRFLPDHMPAEYSEQLTKQNEVIPLPVLFENEQKYDNVVVILDAYEELIRKVHERAEVPMPDIRIHVGGDQLTRERFSGAKRLSIGYYNEPHRFEHLSPITFEFFHMNLNFLILLFKELYDTNSYDELGTMRSEQARIKRENVDKDPRHAYDADKDFTVSFVDAYIVEAALHHFSIPDIWSSPGQILPPEEEDVSQWMETHLGALVDKLVAPDMKSILERLHNERPHPVEEVEEDQVQDDNVVEDGLVEFVTCRNGCKVPMVVPRPKKKPQRKGQNENVDQVRNYAHKVLELGMLFKSLTDMISVPDRDRSLRLLKYAMLIFRENSHLSKYAYEIMRLLVHQFCRLSEKAAHEEFYGLFCNTTGRVDGHVACDDRMEWAVHEVKRHVRHMASNKTEPNIVARTCAVAGVKAIANNFDEATDTITRSKKHSDAASLADEVAMITDLHQLQPFRRQPGRRHQSFACPVPSVLSRIGRADMKTWIFEKKYAFATELGN